MLNDFTCNMTGYIPKHHVNPHGDGIIPYVAERIFQAQPFLDALEIASEKVRAFINSILIRGKQTQEHEHPARKRGQDMEL